MQLVLFEVKDRDMVGYQSADGYKYCCTRELQAKTKCNLDKLIYKVPELMRLLGAQGGTCEHNSHWFWCRPKTTGPSCVRSGSRTTTRRRSPGRR